VNLRARLLIALLSLALLPTLVFTWFTLDQLGHAAERWHQPGVDHALESAVEVSRTVLTRVEATVLERADDWSRGLGPLPLDAAQRSGLREGLREAGLDFAQVYRREGSAWRLADQVVPSGVLAVDSLAFGSEIDAALATDRLLRSPQGVLAGVARAHDDVALVTGIRLTPDFFSRVGRISEAREMYGRFAVIGELQRRYVWRLVPALGLVVAGVAILLAGRLATQMTRPLTRLTGALERVAAGDLDTRVPESGASELRTLASSFNSMAARLAEARTALAVAEREAAWREVARHLAHEIKNPLTPMRLSLHRLQRRVDAVPESERRAVRDSIDALLQEVEHLTRLADNFSRYARLPEPQFEPLDLAELARSAAALHEPDQVTLRVESATPVPIRGDRLLLSRAVHNLLLNACEASPRGGLVEVRTGAGGDEGWVEVLDRGSGVPPELEGRLFEPYVSTKSRGSGLGLSLVKDIAAQHGGRITLENRESGGARARLSLPLHRETTAIDAHS